MWKARIDLWTRSSSSSSASTIGTSTRGGSFKKTANIADDRLRMAAERFYDFSKKLKLLENRVRLHYIDLQRTYKSRIMMMEALSEVSQETPLEELVVGKKPLLMNEDEDDEDEHQPKSSSPHTYSSTARDVHITQEELQQYHNDIVSYVREWETTVSTRVATELKHVTTLYKNYKKYQSKHESLSNAKHKNEQKITWNESKLRTARKEYRRNLIAVTLLTEEVTDRGWKDLVPLLLRMIDFDVHHISSNNTKSILKTLNTIREEMVEISRRYGEMDFEALHKGRLRILREEDAADFVDPEDLQDLESSTIANSFEKQLKVPHNNNHNTTTPPCSDRDSHSTAEDKQSTFERPTEVVLKEKNSNKKNDDDRDDDSCAVPNYPSSIYLVGATPVDDETTLTGAPDLVSV